MATLSTGVSLKYGDASAGRPASYTAIADVTSVPALGAAPASHDVTTLADTSHKYIKGIKDSGGNLDFGCILTEDVIDDITTAIALQDIPKVVEWCVEFPEPIEMRAYFNGEAQYVFNEAVEVDAPLTGTITIIPTSGIEWEAIE
jgi:hypothetical protein